MAIGSRKIMIQNMQVTMLRPTLRNIRLTGGRLQLKVPTWNPKENVWGSMKYFIRHQYKPTNTQSLQEGIKKFRISMTPEVCRHYIDHQQNVIPKVVQVDGVASGY